MAVDIETSRRQKRARDLRYRLRHPERERERHRRYSECHVDQIGEKNRRWYERHKDDPAWQERRRETFRRWRARRSPAAIEAHLGQKRELYRQCREEHLRQKREQYRRYRGTTRGTDTLPELRKLPMVTSPWARDGDGCLMRCISREPGTVGAAFFDYAGLIARRLQLAFAPQLIVVVPQPPVLLGRM